MAFSRKKKQAVVQGILLSPLASLMCETVMTWKGIVAIVYAPIVFKKHWEKQTPKDQ